MQFLLVRGGGRHAEQHAAKPSRAHWAADPSFGWRGGLDGTVRRLSRRARGPKSVSHRGGLAAAGDAELAEDVRHVNARRLARDEELFGDLLVGAAVGQQV